MADIDVVIGLEHARYKAALAEVERATGRTANNITNAFRLGGLITAFRMAKKSMSEFAEDSLQARHEMEAWGKAAHGVWASIGREITLFSQQYRQSITDAVKATGAFLRNRQNTVHDFFFSRKFGDPSRGESGADFDAARTADEESQKEFAYQRRRIELERAMQSQLDRDREADARSRGDTLTAEALEAARKVRERTAEINQNPDLRAADRGRMVDTIQAQHDASVSEAARKAIREAEENVRAARRSMGVREAGSGIGGDRFVRDAMFGMQGARPDPVREAQEKLLRIQEQSKELLKQISQKVGQRQPARAG